MKNQFCWMQLQSADLPQAKNFYQKLFDWKLNDTSAGEQTNTEIDAGDGPIGGMTELEDIEQASIWLPFVQVDNIQQQTTKAQALGAQIIVPSTSINEGNDGYYSVFLDPTGAPIGLYQPPE